MYNLTNHQKALLTWIVEQIKTENIGEEFLVVWGSGNGQIQGLRESSDFSPQITVGALSVFAHFELMLCIPRHKSQSDGKSFSEREYNRTCVLLETAYIAVASNFDDRVQVATNPKRQKIRENLGTLFDEIEIKEVCFDMQIDYGEVQGKDKRETILNLITYVERRYKLDELQEILTRRRPYATW